MSRLKAV